MADPRGAREFDLREVVRALRRQWLVIVAITAVFVAGSLVLSFLEKPVYQATATLLVSQGGPDEILQSRSLSPTEAQRRLDTEIQLMQSAPVRRAVNEALGHGARVSVSALGNTDVLALRALAPTPEQAAQDANTYANTYIDVRRQQTIDDLLAAGVVVQAKIDEIDDRVADLEAELTDVNNTLVNEASGTARFAELTADKRRLEAELETAQATAETQRASYTEELDRLQVSANLTAEGGTRVVSEATRPAAPIKPTPTRSAIAAGFLGLLVGVAVALARDYWDDTVSSKQSLELVAPDVAVVGLIPHVPDWRDRRDTELVSSTQPSSPAAEAYRSLRTSIKFLGVHRPIKTLQVTSSVASEGKSTTAANIATAFARSGSRVIVVCCDLRRPRLHQFFGLANTTGFTSVLLGEVAIKDAVQTVPGEERLLVLSAGPTPPNPSELLGSPRAAETLRLLAESADLVVIDSPPVIPVTDAAIISGMVDATIVVAAAGLTKRRAYGRSIEQLAQVNAPVVGAVLNDLSDKGLSSEYGYQYGYQYGGSSTSSRSSKDGADDARSPSGAPVATSRTSPE